MCLFYPDLARVHAAHLLRRARQRQTRALRDLLVTPSTHRRITSAHHLGRFLGEFPSGTRTTSSSAGSPFSSSMRSTGTGGACPRSSRTPSTACIGSSSAASSAWHSIISTSGVSRDMRIDMRRDARRDMRRDSRRDSRVRGMHLGDGPRRCISATYLGDLNPVRRQARPAGRGDSTIRQQAVGERDQATQVQPMQSAHNQRYQVMLTSGFESSRNLIGTWRVITCTCAARRSRASNGASLRSGIRSLSRQARAWLAMIIPNERSFITEWRIFSISSGTYVSK